MIFRTGYMKTFSDVRGTRHLGIGLFVVAVLVALSAAGGAAEETFLSTSLQSKRLASVV